MRFRWCFEQGYLDGWNDCNNVHVPKGGSIAASVGYFNGFRKKRKSFKVNPHGPKDYKERREKPTTPVRRSTTIGKLKKFKF